MLNRILDRILDYIEREPARFVGSVMALLGAIVALLLAFGTVSTGQAAAMTAALAAIAKFANEVIVRALVMPMSKVAALVQAPAVDNGDRDATPPPAPPSNPPEAA